MYTQVPVLKFNCGLHLLTFPISPLSSQSLSERIEGEEKYFTLVY